MKLDLNGQIELGCYSQERFALLAKPVECPLSTEVHCGTEETVRPNAVETCQLGCESRIALFSPRKLRDELGVAIVLPAFGQVHFREAHGSTRFAFWSPLSRQRHSAHDSPTSSGRIDAASDCRQAQCRRPENPPRRETRRDDRLPHSPEQAGMKMFGRSDTVADHFRRFCFRSSIRMSVNVSFILKKIMLSSQSTRQTRSAPSVRRAPTTIIRVSLTYLI